MKRSIIVIAVFLLIFSTFSTLGAATIPREDYIKYLELSYPRIIQQPPASRYFALYGDKESSDIKILIQQMVLMMIGFNCCTD